MPQDVIRIGGAREHNLKNITLEIPRNQLVVFTGLSGSGKSSLAFDTIFAEGQRKYVESLSVYARQFLDQLQKPEVDYIEGLSPAIAIEQQSSGATPRSTIATTTEIYDYLRLLYANAGNRYCPTSGVAIIPQTTSDIVDKLCALPTGTRVMLLAPVVQDQRGEFREVLERLAREGFVRARIDGDLVELGAQSKLKLDPKAKHSIDIVVDRLVIDEKVRVRLGDSVEIALRVGQSRLLALHQPPQSSNAASSTAWTQTLHSNRAYSPATGQSFEPVTPKHFSFNSPSGACALCQGLGQKMVLDETLVIPDPTKSLEQGAVLPWRRGGKRMVSYYKAMIKGLARHFKVSLESPYKDLPQPFKEALLHGTGEKEVEFHFMKGGVPTATSKSFEGVIPNLERLLVDSESEFTKNRLKSFMSPTHCDACHGERLMPEILAIRLGEGPSSRWSTRRNPRLPDLPGLSIMELCSLSIGAIDHFLAEIKLTEFQKKIVADVVREIRARLGFLRDVGLDYLTLNRESGTLSGGEAQRIRLATQIGGGLVGVLYILDEPSIGLHQRDNDRLLHTLRHLRDLGNSVLVVEHDEDTIRSADYVVDIGPGAGVGGGEVVAAGTLAQILSAPQSLTAKYLSGELGIAIPKVRLKPSTERGWLEVIGASENNLQEIDFRVPIGLMTCVTGVSGSGKSTIVDDIIRRALMRIFFGSKERPGAHRELRGHDLVDKVIVVDQSPIGRTPRSNPATYTGIFNHIRDLFARLPSAKIRGYTAGRFSFNIKGGRCEKCQGDGLICIEMHFLPPVYVTCEACDGKRYNRETLEIAYKGVNIADVLHMTIDDAVTFFRSVPQIYEPCLVLAEVGLGYIRLGQSATTLSGGEAQRLKLATELSRKATGRTLYILDEPTTGLHFHDVAKLLEVLFKLRAPGNTLLIIEHNLDVVKTADWVIDLGPEGGSGGGHIVSEGTPEQVAACADSHTGRFLSRLLSRPRA